MRMATQRQLSSFHEVSTDGQSWQAAQCVPELFPRQEPAVHVSMDANVEPSSESVEDDTLIPFPTAGVAQANQYSYSRQGEIYGPVSLRRLKQMIELAQLGSDDLISAGNGVFLPAREYPELTSALSVRLAAIARPSAPPSRAEPTTREPLEPDAVLSGADIALIVLLPGVALIVAIVWIAQGKPKGHRAIWLSVLAPILWVTLFATCIAAGGVGIIVSHG